MLHIFHLILLKLPPETAHHIVVFVLKIYQVFYSRIKNSPAVKKVLFPSLPQVLFGNRVGLAGGFDKQAEIFPALLKMGFGFVELGTVTLQAQKGNPKPRLWRTANQTLINQMGFNSVGARQFLSNLRKIKKYAPDSSLFINVGINKESNNPLQDYVELFQLLKSEAAAFVVNVSSPNTPGLRSLQSTDFIFELEKKLSPVPTFIKLAPDLTNDELSTLCESISQTKLVGVILTNTSKSLAIKLGKSEGGLSGTLLFDRALECVSLARKKLNKDKIIIAVGGISSLADAEKMRRAGADLVQVYTAFVYQGPSLIKKLALLN